MKQAKMIIDKAFLKLIKEFTDLLSSILAELFMMEFISREIRYQMKMDSVQMY